MLGFKIQCLTSLSVYTAIFRSNITKVNYFRLFTQPGLNQLLDDLDLFTLHSSLFGEHSSLSDMCASLMKRRGLWVMKSQRESSCSSGCSGRAEF